VTATAIALWLLAWLVLRLRCVGALLAIGLLIPFPPVADLL